MASGRQVVPLLLSSRPLPRPSSRRFSHRLSLFHYSYLVIVITISASPTAPMNRREVSFRAGEENFTPGWREREREREREIGLQKSGRGEHGGREEDEEKKEDKKEEGDRTKKELGNRGERSLLRGFVVGPPLVICSCDILAASYSETHPAYVPT